MKLFEQKIRERLVIDETSPSGLRWGALAYHQVRGKPAGRMNNHGYWEVAVRCSGSHRLFQAHRVVWLLAHGRWPKEDIDHINTNKADNRISNLREASRGENLRNARISTRNSSGVKGVSFDKRSEKWLAIVMCDGKTARLGLYDSIADAERAVRFAREQLHGEFANHGSKAIS